MKKDYIIPKLEIIEMTEEYDIVTTSDGLQYEDSGMGDSSTWTEWF